TKGATATGTDHKPLGNSFDGILIQMGASDNTIGVGGTGSGLGNVISGNSLDGIRITDGGTAKNIVQGNKIGTDAAGAFALANTFDGIGIVNFAGGNFIG